MEEPEKKEGIWVQTDNQYENIIVDNELFNSDIVISNTVENFMPITVNIDPSYNIHACVHKNNIYMTFNRIGTEYDNFNVKLYKYNGNAWTNIINVLYKTYGDAYGIFSFNNKLYIILATYGGYSGVYYNRLYYYDEATSTIKREAELPRNKQIQGVFLYNNKINILQGGYIAIYDFINKTFTEASYNNINGTYSGSDVTFPAVYNGKIYVNYSGALSVLEYNQLPANISPSSAGGCAKFSINNKLYQFGNEYNAYNIALGNYINHGSVVVNNKLYLGDGSMLIYIDPDNNVFGAGSIPTGGAGGDNVPRFRSGSILVAGDNNIYGIVNHADASFCKWVTYNPNTNSWSSLNMIANYFSDSPCAFTYNNIAYQMVCNYYTDAGSGNSYNTYAIYKRNPDNSVTCALVLKSDMGYFQYNISSAVVTDNSIWLLCNSSNNNLYVRINLIDKNAGSGGFFTHTILAGE